MRCRALCRRPKLPSCYHVHLHVRGRTSKLGKISIEQRKLAYRLSAGVGPRRIVRVTMCTSVLPVSTSPRPSTRTRTRTRTNPGGGGATVTARSSGVGSTLCAERDGTCTTEQQLHEVGQQCVTHVSNVCSTQRPAARAVAQR